jgi:hypothetical protein
LGVGSENATFEARHNARGKKNEIAYFMFQRLFIGAHPLKNIFLLTRSKLGLPKFLATANTSASERRARYRRNKEGLWLDEADENRPKGLIARL